MKKLKTGLILLSVVIAQQGSAKVITPSEALGRIKQETAGNIMRRAGLEPRLAHTTLTTDGEAAVYIFSGDSDNGFLVLSADDEALPLLGYSDHGSFSAEQIPPQMQWWLSEYASQIEYARKNGIKSDKQTRPFSTSGQRQAIEPLLKTMWDQIAPYNNQCPLDGTERTWTGCVATSLAQVMKYFEYPEKGTGQITYTIESLQKKVSMNFALKSFDWKNMLDTYSGGQYTDQQAEAVSYLMKACGYAVKMQYGLDSSGALALNIRNGLVKYFNYDPATQYALRAYYSTTQWDNMIYENLKNVGPVIYGGGSALGGGHSFVCDGYDGQGMYHFNWGWSGISDGYFSLEALNPGSLGTGGGTGGGYNFTQDAILGLQPNTGKPAPEQPMFLTQEGELTGAVTGSILSFSIVNTSNPGWVNYNPGTVNVKFGAMFQPQGSTGGDTKYLDISPTSISLEPGYGVNVASLQPSVDLSKLNLRNGTYKVVVGSTILDRGATSSETDGEGWVEIKPSYGMPNYVTLKVDNGSYTVTDHLLPALKITGEFTTPLYYGCLVGVKVTVENTADVDRVSGFAPILIDEQGPLMLGQSVFVNIPAHSSVTREWTTDLTQFVQYIDPYLNKPLTFTFFDEDGYNFYNNEFAQTVTLEEAPTVVGLNVTNFAIQEAIPGEDNFFVITDPRNINVTADMRIFGGYFAYNVLACLCVPYNDSQIEILDATGSPVFMSASNRKASFSTTICYPVMEPGQPYFIALAYDAPGGLAALANPIPVKLKGNPDGIDAVADDAGFVMSTDSANRTITVAGSTEIKSVEVYDISGRRIDLGAEIDGNHADIAVSNSGIVIVRIMDADSNSTVMKTSL